MKKTPLQELIDFMEQSQYFIGNDLYAKQKELLEEDRANYEIRRAAAKVVISNHFGSSVILNEELENLKQLLTNAKTNDLRK